MSEKSPQELYDERLTRVKNVIALQPTDRVPVFGHYQQYPYRFAGITFEQAMNDYPAARAACHKFVDYFQPDIDFGPVFAYPAKPMETLGYTAFKWPGHGLGPDHMYQYVEGEYMTADEYDEFLFDPSDFMQRKWAPRQFSALGGFEQIVPWRRFMWSGWMNFGFFASPEMRETLERAMKAGEQMNEWWGSQMQYWDEVKAKGFPVAYAGFDWTPFDIIGDTLRGTRGILTDMRRNPEKLQAALKIATRIFVEYGSGAAGAELPLVWIWMHKGATGFMSDENFRTFYWPPFREGLIELTEMGVVPVVVCEANVIDRLEYFADVPKGKIIYHVAQTDLAAAKEALGGTAAIMGNVPNSMMVAGSPDEVADYVKRSIDIAGKDGGYIVDTAVMLDEAKPENLKAMIDTAKEYGVY